MRLNWWIQQNWCYVTDISDFVQVPTRYFELYSYLACVTVNKLRQHLYQVWDYLSMLGLKLIHVSKRGPGRWIASVPTKWPWGYEWNRSISNLYKTQQEALRELKPQPIEQFHKSHNAPVPYPQTQYSKQKCVHLGSEWCIMGYGISALWDLWDCFIKA